MNQSSPQIPAVSRRHLVRAAAWTVPAVTLVSAAPAFAASGSPNQLRVNVVEAAWRDVADEYVRLRLTVTNLAPINAGTLSLQFTFTGPWVRFDNGVIARVDVDATAGGTKWGGTWTRSQTTDHSGTGDARQATTIFTLPSLPRMSTSGILDLTFNTGNSKIYGDTTPIAITPTTIPRDFTMALNSATKIVPTT